MIESSTCLGMVCVPMDNHWIVYMSIKDEKGVLQDIPLHPFVYEHEAQIYITGYVDAIVNHTGEADEAKVKGQFSIRNMSGNVDVNKEEESSANKGS